MAQEKGTNSRQKTFAYKECFCGEEADMFNLLEVSDVVKKGDPVRALETRHIFSKQAPVEQAERKS